MAGVITNVINTVFTSKGAKKVERETEAIGRAQTRLGQSSASAGRSFAAQSTGLGGLVGAYAGAAATIFALTAAFDALAKAAAADNIVKGTNVLAASVGQVGPQLIASIKEITDGQVTLAEAAQNANIALSTGFSSNQILGLTEVANKAARTLGRDLTDAFQRLVRGTSKLEPELLDELGIFVRLDPAVKAYADQLGKTASELNEFERRQAFANAAIEEGNRKFGIIDTGAKSAQKTLEQFRVKISEFFTEFLQAFSSIVTPFLDFFNNNAGAGLLAFAVILKQVFRNAGTEVAGFATQSIANIARFSDRLADSVKLDPRLFSTLTANFNTAFKAANPSIGAKPYIGQDQAQFDQFKAYLAAQRQGELNSVSALRRANEAYNAQIAAIDTRLGRQTALSKLLDKQIAQNEKIIAQSSRASRTFLGLSTGVTSFAKGVGTFLGGLFNLVNTIFFVVTAVQGLLSIFGVDLIGGIIKLFKDFNKEVEEAERGLSSIISGINGRNFEKEIKLIDPDATAKDIQELIQESQKRLQQELNASNTTVSVMSNAGYTSIIAQNKPIEEQISLLTQVDKLIDDLTNKRAKGSLGETDSKFLAYLLSIQKVLMELGEVSFETQALLTKLSDTTGISGAELVASLGVADKQLFSIDKQSITVLGLVIENYDRLTTAQKKYVISGVSAINTFRLANDSFVAGTATAEQLGKQIAGISEQYIALQRNSSQVIDDLVAGGKSYEEAFLQVTSAISKTRQELDTLRDIRTFVADVENAIKGIKSTFSSEIKLVQSGVWDGIVASSGIVAQNEEQIRKNQITQLLTTLKANNVDKNILANINEKVKNNEEITELEAEKLYQAELYNNALIAAKGLITSSIIEISKITEEQKDQLKDLKAANALRKEEVGLLIQREQIAYNKLLGEIEIKNLERALELDKARLETAKNSLALLEAQVSAIAEIDTKSYNKLDAATKKIVDARKDLVIDSLDSLSSNDDSFGISKAANDLKTALESGLKKEEALIRLRIAITKQQQDAELALFDNETRIIQQKTLQDISNVRAEQSLFLAETNFERSKLRAEESIIKAETEILRTEIEILKGNAELVSSQLDNTNKQVEVVNSFGEHIGTFVRAINKLGEFASTMLEAATGEGRGFSPIETGSQTPIPRIIGTDVSIYPENMGPQAPSPIEQVIATAKEGLKTIADVEEARLAAVELERTAINEVAKLKAAQYTAELDELRQLYLDTSTLRAEERAALILDQKEKLTSLEKELIDLGVAAGNAGDKTNDLKTMLTNIFSGIESAVQGAFTGIKDFLIFGEGDLRTVFSDLFKNIGNTIFEEAINKPISNMLTQTIFKGIYGDKAMGMIADGTIYNPYYVKFADNDVAGLLGLPKSGDKNDPATKIKEVTGGFFDNIKEGFSGAFGFIKNILSGFGSFAGNIFKGIFSFIGSIFGLAAGGAVHRAGGGAIPQFAAGGGLRDRVPTLLEPGEFVLRRMAAGAIGMPALQQMNATGQMPGNGSAPVINFKNEGTPKDMEASQPRFDGEKYVIDIITRDLQNNGPIRKTLRGGL